MSYMQKFMFDDLPIRGQLVVLEDCWQTIVLQRDYPLGLQQLLGELLAANVLLTSNLKLHGKVICQLQDNPHFQVVVSECNHKNEVRATAKFHAEDIALIDYAASLKQGHLVVSVDSNDDARIYQSIIALNGHSVADILNNYMAQSEQLKTKFLISYTPQRVVGFMLQQLPDVHNRFDREIERVFMLAETLTKHELNHDSLERILHKLFNEDNLVIYQAEQVKFACSCSRERVGQVLRGLGKAELQSIILEQGNITVNCDYCQSEYKFTQTELEQFVLQLSLDEINAISEQLN